MKIQYLSIAMYNDWCSNWCTYDDNTFAIELFKRNEKTKQLYDFNLDWVIMNVIKNVVLK